jgi:6-phosphofructokinase
MEILEDLRKREKIRVSPHLEGLPKNVPIRVGVLFSGGPAAGGSNVVAGIFDALHEMNPKSELLGFLKGPSGLIEGKFKILSSADIDPVRNLGGFDLLGTGRTKIETPEQFEKAMTVIKENHLDGLVIIGGDDSNTNAYFLHKYLRENNLSCSVVGVPKTIDGDLKSKEVEISFGFDTASKVYSEMISNICTDAKSSLKYWHFIKLMGRTASHVTLECALQTAPNLALIGEEISQKKWSLDQIIAQVADTVEDRASQGKNYGVILIPEGLIEFIQGAKESLAQLLAAKDSHGNTKVSQIETERLLSKLVAEELIKRGSSAKFDPFHHFFGYEGRCSFPSVFDATYCYNLGLNAALLISNKKSGVMTTIKNLAKDVSEWKPAHIDLEGSLVEEERVGKLKKVVAKSLVDMDGPVFAAFLKVREKNRVGDHYKKAGPIQFYGPLKDQITLTLELENNSK